MNPLMVSLSSLDSMIMLTHGLQKSHYTKPLKMAWAETLLSLNQEQQGDIFWRIKN